MMFDSERLVLWVALVVEVLMLVCWVPLFISLTREVWKSRRELPPKHRANR